MTKTDKLIWLAVILAWAVIVVMLYLFVMKPA